MAATDSFLVLPSHIDEIASPSENTVYVPSC